MKASDEDESPLLNGIFTVTSSYFHDFQKNKLDTPQ